MLTNVLGATLQPECNGTLTTDSGQEATASALPAYRRGDTHVSPRDYTRAGTFEPCVTMIALPAQLKGLAGQHAALIYALCCCSINFSIIARQIG